MSDDEDDRDRKSRPLDPEVLADLQKRDASERDPKRTRPLDVNKLYTPFAPVAQWKCRHPKCGVMIEVDDGATHALDVHNAELKNRDERLIPTDAIVLCDEHRALAESYRVEALKKRHQVLREAIVALKASSNPRAEHELIATLKATHHPDIEGLLTSLEGKLSGPKRKKSL